MPIVPKYFQTFEVRGRYPFPIDMLRYDGCFPIREAEDSGGIARSIEQHGRGEDMEKPIRLGRYVERRSDLPTAHRWRSFGWLVLRYTIETIDPR